jgi:Beta-galactosidase
MRMERFKLPLPAFRGVADARLTPWGDEGIRLNAPPDGGGARLDAALLPANVWSEYRYVVADIYHECHDVLVVLFSFTDDTGRVVTVHYGVLPRVETTLCLPLAALGGEKLFLDRFPGVLQSVLRGDAFVDRRRIKELMIATIPSVVPRSLVVSQLSLQQEPPPFRYTARPYIDELGQLSGKEWNGKTEGAAALVRELNDELQQLRGQAAPTAEYGRYGGWKALRFEASGYFRTVHDGERWWFVDPDGYALFSAGMDCIHPAEAARLDGMEHLLPQPFEPGEEFREAWQRGGYSFGIANLIRAFGGDWRERWMELTERRMKHWGINTIGNWSHPKFIRYSELPYVYPMTDFPETAGKLFRDFPDVFSEEYDRNAQAFAEQLLPLREDRRLIGYFMRNEPHWAFVDGLDLTEQMLRSPRLFASKAQLAEWLRDRYGSIDRLNEAWDGEFIDFSDIIGDSGWLDDQRIMEQPGRKADFTAFNRLMIRRYVEIPAKYCKKAAPNHLNLGMRYAWVGSEDVLEGCEAFDVFSINCYQMEPPSEMIRRISDKLSMPLMIGEFHFGAADAGMPAYGIRALATQEDRGKAYRYFVENAAAVPELIGVHYFQLNDQPVLGRFDGENYQIGAVDVCQRPYHLFTEAMREAHSRMYRVRAGELAPASERPVEIPKTGF